MSTEVVLLRNIQPNLCLAIPCTLALKDRADFASVAIQLFGRKKLRDLVVLARVYQSKMFLHLGILVFVVEVALTHLR